MLSQDLAHFVVQPVFDGELFHHLLAYAQNNCIRRLGFNLFPFDEPLDNLRRHVAHVVTSNEHSDRVPFHKSKRVSLLAAFAKRKAAGFIRESEDENRWCLVAGMRAQTE
jgi:hypothetical protein